MRRNVVINWGVSSYFGWGVYGLNLALNWAHDPDLAFTCASSVDPAALAVDAVRMAVLSPFLQRSAALHAQLKGREEPAVAQGPMLASLLPNFRVAPAQGARLSGQPTLGVTFFETAVHPADAIAMARNYPQIITGSSWNEQVLRAYGLTNVRTILQGVDPSLFHPAPQVSYAGDRFLVFSGGKLEHRKGQDIAVVAFRRFAERHPDAVLVTAWHSPWPQVARSVDKSGLAAPVTFDANGQIDTAAWAVANGIRPESYLDAGRTPNPLMPQLYRQMDVGFFPNRCEGGTNLVAMECMACGVPTILSANSGHLDLIEDDNCYVLRTQRTVAGDPAAAGYGNVAGWGESDVDEAVELLEQAYADRAAARARGLRGAQTLSRLTWAKTAAEVKATILEFSA